MFRLTAFLCVIALAAFASAAPTAPLKEAGIRRWNHKLGSWNKYAHHHNHTSWSWSWSSGHTSVIAATSSAIEATSSSIEATSSVAPTTSVVESASSAAPTSTVEASSSIASPSSTFVPQTSTKAAPTTSIPTSSSTSVAHSTTSTRAPVTTTTTRTSSTSSSAAPAATSASSGSSTQEQYLAPHNAARAQRGASPLTWSSELEASAQAWANNCEFKHSGSGENLSAGTGDFSIAQGIKLWTDEAGMSAPTHPVT